MKPVYVFNLPYENKHELFLHFITLYGVCQNLAKGKNYLRPKLAEVLTYYVVMGYSDETKKYIVDNHEKMNYGNLNNINSQLTKKGYLVTDKYRAHFKHLSTELQTMKDYIENDVMPMFIAKCKKSD